MKSHIDEASPDVSDEILLDVVFEQATIHLEDDDWFEYQSPPDPPRVEPPKLHLPPPPAPRATPDPTPHVERAARNPELTRTDEFDADYPDPSWSLTDSFDDLPTKLGESDDELPAQAAAPESSPDRFAFLSDAGVAAGDAHDVYELQLVRHGEIVSSIEIDASALKALAALIGT